MYEKTYAFVCKTYVKECWQMHFEYMTCYVVYYLICFSFSLQKGTFRDQNGVFHGFILHSTRGPSSGKSCVLLTYLHNTNLMKGTPLESTISYFYYFSGIICEHEIVLVEFRPFALHITKLIS